MPLFDLPATRSTKASDNKIAKQSQAKAKKVPATVRGSGNISQRIASAKALVEKALGQLKEDYDIIWTRAKLHDYLTECLRQGVVSLDTETTGLDPIADDIAGFSLCTYNAKAVYIPINHINYITHERIDGQISIVEVKDELDWFFSHQLEVVMFNAVFDIRVIRNQTGCKKIYCTWDTSLASRCLNENEKEKNLKALHAYYVLDGKEEYFRFDDLFKGIPFTQVPIKTGYVYAAHDAKITLELYDFQKPYLTVDDPVCIEQELVDVAHVFHDIEMPCVPVVVEMEDTGCCLDLDYTKELSVKYHALLEDKTRAAYDIISEYQPQIDEFVKQNPSVKLDNPIKISSSSQLAILLYDIIGIGVVDKKKPRGVGKKILLKVDLPIAKAILEYRAVSKLINTYIDKLPKCLNKKDGRLHGKFNQYGADTGRFSSSDPNLQNIPSHNKDIRPMFQATPGYVMMSSDYSQQEPKVMTQMCQDESMKQAYRDGKDLYAEIASLAFNESYEDCLEFYLDEDGNETEETNEEGKERRSQAKSILLGALYGRGIKSIADQLRTTEEKAQQIKDKVFKGFPAIPKFEQDSLYMAEEYGFVTTLWGRKRRFPIMLEPDYEFRWTDDDKHLDILDFNNNVEVSEVPEAIQDKYWKLLERAKPWDKKAIFEKANKEGIWIIDNTKEKTDTIREIVNARIQGSAADMTKLAMIRIYNNKRLTELGFRLLIQVHDELIGECPRENMEECVKLFSEEMSNAAKGKLEIPVNCDVVVTERWYGESINGTVKEKESNTAREFENELYDEDTDED